MSAMKKSERIKKILLGIFIIVILLLLTFLIGKPILNLANDTEKLKAIIDNNWLLGRLLYITLCIVQVLLALIPSEALEVGGGYIFGYVESTILCLIGISIGSALVIILTKKFGRKFVNLFYSDEKIDSIKIFKNEKRLSGLVFILFLIPGTPKDVMTYVVGLTKLKVSTYLLLTSIARIPSIIISTIAGSMLADDNYHMALLFFTISAVTGIIGFLVYKLYFDKQEKKSKNSL